MINKNQINLINKRIFLVKIQAVIFIVAMVLALYFGWLNSSLADDNKISAINILVALTEAIFYKVYILLLSTIMVCKVFYLSNYKNSKRYLLGVLLNLLPIYICFVNLYALNNLSITPIISLFCGLFYIYSIFIVHKFYNPTNQISLFKSFIYLNFSTIFMFFAYIGLLYDIYATKEKELGLFMVLLGLVSAIFIPLSVLLSIPLNLISEYRYFKKELETQSQTNK